MTALAKYYIYLSSMVTVAMKEREEGQSLAEYGLILALIAVVAIAAVSTLGSTISDFLGQVADGFGGGS